MVMTVRSCIKVAQGSFDQGLLLRVQTRSRFIQDQDRGILKESPCHRQALGLPGAQACALLADHGWRIRPAEIGRIRPGAPGAPPPVIPRLWPAAWPGAGWRPIVSWKRCGSWGTQANTLRQVSSGMPLDGSPLRDNPPRPGSINRSSRAARVVLPTPLEPTTAICSPARISRARSCMAGSLSPG